MAPSQKSAENFNKKLAAKAKRGIVASGAAGMGKTVDPKSLKPKELPCPHCDRLFKQIDRLKQHVAKHHAAEVAEAAVAAKAAPPPKPSDTDKSPDASSSQKPSSSASEKKKEKAADATPSWEWNGQPQATVFRSTTKDPKTILSEYISKKRDVKKPKYTLTETPDGTGWTCKVVIPDKYKPDKDVVVFCDDVCVSKDEAQQRGAVAALARVANNLPLHRLLPNEYKQVFSDLEKKESLKIKNAKLLEEDKERRRLFKPKDPQRQELHMSEEKRNLVEDLLRESFNSFDVSAGTQSSSSHDLEDTSEEAKEAADTMNELLTAKLSKLGFGDTDVATAMRAVSQNGKPRTENAEMDWLCLNVPEGRLPRRFAPNAKNEPIVLMDTAKVFAPAGGLSSRVVNAFTDNELTGGTSNSQEEPAPSDSKSAYLWNCGYYLEEVRDALKTAEGKYFPFNTFRRLIAHTRLTILFLLSGSLEQAHLVLFRGLLQSVVPRDDGWRTWPAASSPTTAKDDSSAEDDPWEHEAIALEAIVGDDKFHRVSVDRFEVVVESSVGNATLEITRPEGHGYPGYEPPLLALVPIVITDGDDALNNSVKRNAIRTATEAMAVAAASAAANGATCVYELLAVARIALAENERAPDPVSRTSGLTSVSQATDEARAPNEEVSHVSLENKQKSTSSIPKPNAFPAQSLGSKAKPFSASASALKPTAAPKKPNRSRVVSKEFQEKESVRLKAAFDCYFANGSDFSSKKMVATRAALPASGSREEVVAAVSKHPVVILSGETGCGKSTQVPQFILESEIFNGRGGEVNIVCTQPRRISAIGLAERVSSERLERCGDVVGYSVRLESKLSDKTRLHFMTMGILLRRLLGDPALTGVTHVVLDEVHERSVESDLLLLLLRRLLLKRTDLRVVLMSATADADFFADYFTKPNPASVLAGITSVETVKVFIKGFTHPVREYFLEDALEMTGFTVGKASKWAVKKNANTNGGYNSNTKVADANVEAVGEASADDTLSKESNDTPAPDVVPEDWEDDEDRVRVPLRPTCPVPGETSATTWDEKDVSKKPASKKARDANAAATRERLRQDELAEASRRLAEYSEPTQRSIGNIDESLLNYELIEMLIASIINTEQTNGEHALVAAPAPGQEKNTNEKSLGAILIFLPGQMEITRLIRNCERSRFLEANDVGELQVRGFPNHHVKRRLIAHTRTRRDYSDQKGLYERLTLSFLSCQFLPLYGALSSNDQRRIFQNAPPGVRKIVVSTNIAETSVTIDDVRYVIDCGRAKEMGYDSTRGLSVLADAWISRAASMQRRGRAGRTAPGACFALFSRKARANLTPHQPPEMLRTPLQQLCLNIKALTTAGSIQETLASAPTPPEVGAVQTALDELCALRALDPVSETLTPLGRHIAHMPVDARIGKMLLFGALLGCLDPILTIAAAMAGRPIFVSPKDAKQEADAAKRRMAAPGKSDHLTAASAYKEWYKSGTNTHTRRKFAERNFLSQQALEGVMASRLDYAAVLADLGFVSRDYLLALKRDGHGGGVADRNAQTGRVVKAALVAGFYPQVVRVKHPDTKFVQTSGGTVEKVSISHLSHSSD